MKSGKVLNNKATVKTAQELANAEKENLFSKYLYAPTNSYKALTHKPISQVQNPTMNDYSDSCSSADDCRVLDEGVNGIIQKDSMHQSSNTFQSNTTGNMSSTSGVKIALNETLEDFQENEMGIRVKSKLAAKSQEDLTFICIMCQGDFTHLTLDERSMHVNQCIDYHSSAVATSSQTITPAVHVLECPLCFKQLPSDEARITHVKKCGKSRGLSIQSVIQAIHLQEKHTLERKALGLPLNVKAKPVKPPKKPVAKKLALQPKSTMQSDLQLAKALSLSLKDNESSSQLTIVPTNTEDVSFGILQAPAEFQNPGRQPSKKKRRLASTTLLLLRTEEERKKIIQDKVDAIIALPHKCEKDEENIEEFKNTTNEQKAAHLWNLSSIVSDKSSYYVDQLLDWIKPSDIEVGSKLCNLSQIPGHRIFTQLPCDYTFSCADKTSTSDVMMESDNPSSSLASSLRSLIGNSWMSDVDIHTASGIVIPAHKIFLALRCPSLKHAFDEPIECGKYILNWKNTSFDAALHFLNFIYTGSTEWKEEVIEELTHLAEKYEVGDLLTILNDSKTLEMLISEEPEAEQSVTSPMDSDFGYKDNGIVGCNTLKEDKNSHQNNKAESPNSEQVNSLSIDEHLKEDKDIESSYFSAIGTGFESKCNFTENSNSFYSPPSTAQLSNFDKVVLDISKDNIENRKSSSYDTHLNTCITDSNSSDDSCKILQSIDSCESSRIMKKLSPKPSFERQETSTSSSHQQTPLNTSKHSLTKKDILPETSFHSLCEDNCNFYKERPASSRLEPDNVLNDSSNEGLFIVKELTDKSDSFDERNSLALDNTLPLENGDHSSQKLSSFSSVFQNDDLDAAICLSRNTSFQDQNISGIRSWGCEPSPVSFRTNSYASLDRLSSDGKSRKQHFNSDLSPIKGNSFYNEASNSNTVDDVFVDNECEIVSSPEILVCDSDDENPEIDSIRNSFKTYESLSQNFSSPPKNKLRTDFPNVVTEKENAVCERPHYNSITSHDDEKILQSANKERDTVFSETFFNKHESLTENCIVQSETTSNSNRSPKKLETIVPEVIFCDSNSDDKMEPITFSQSLNISDNCLKNIDDDCISTNFETPKELKTKSSPSKNLLLSSPDSPWTFRTDKSSKDYEVPKKIIKSSKSSAILKTLSSVIPDKKLPKNSSLENIKTTKSTITTPKDLIKFKISDSPITPLPDYRNMVTPEIKEALKKIGVKALPRKKAIAVLSHVYDEIHPWNDGTSGSSEQDFKSTSQSKPKSLSQKKTLSLPKKRKETAEICESEAKKKVKKCSSADQQSSKVQDKAAKKYEASCSSLNKRTDDNEHINSSSESVKNSSFGSINSKDGEAHNLSISSEFSDSGLSDSKESTEHIKKYILSNNELYTKILNYTPINLAEFQQELKENEIKISMKRLTDYLDEQCITFTYPRKEEYKKKQQVRTQRFRKRMIAKLSQKGSSNLS